MKKKPKTTIKKTKLQHLPKKALSGAHRRVKPHVQRASLWYRARNFFHKLLIWLLVIFLILTACAYGVSQWYVQKHASEPVKLGATFIPQYARHLDLDAEQTLEAGINDLGIRHFRLVSYWNYGEPANNNYDFKDLDWQFDKIEKAGGTISLAIGARQPRWPECHIPDWAKQLPGDQWKSELKEYMGVVINRYKDRPSLKSYQLENEYFLEVFGECEDHDRERLVDEFNYVKLIDPDKPIIVSRSNNATPSWPIGEPRADIVGASIYKRVWDRTVTKRYFEYPFPAWFYSFLAGATELTTGRNTIVHEMQAEPWPPTDIKATSIAEQDKSFSAERFGPRVDFAVSTGMKSIDLWGMEWWYWRKIKYNDSSLWDIARDQYQKYNACVDTGSRNWDAELVC